MPTPTFQPLGGDPTTQQIQDYIVKLIRDLNFLLSNLDTVNVNRLDAKVLIAQTITADKISANTITANEIAANAITTSELQAGAVTADKISVAQLSAISADIGTITAGSITSNTTVNVGTDMHVGQSIYMNASSFQSTIYLTPNVYIYFDPAAQSLRLVAPGGVYANGKRIDI